MAKRSATQQDNGITTVLIEVPLLDAKNHKSYGHVDVQLRGQRAPLQNVWRKVHMALKTSHAQLSCGKHVDSPADAIRWVLERIAAEEG
jgi:hypothetical protein